MLYEHSRRRNPVEIRIVINQLNINQMKKILLFALPLLAMCFASCEKEEEWTDDSPIIQFKDPRFLAAVLIDDFYGNIDRNSDGQISEKEALLAEDLDLGGGIRSLEEISYFTNLQVLKCESNELTSLDLSKNTALTELYCDRNQLTSLDVSNNTALAYLNCSANELTSLDVSNNTALTTLSCGTNQLTSLDLSNNTALTKLTKLWCGNNPLTKITLYRYHMLEDDVIQRIRSEYGNIIEYVE